jgi:hypothetical protein
VFAGTANKKFQPITPREVESVTDQKPAFRSGRGYL